MARGRHHPLVGVWELVSFQVRHPDGRTDEPLGADPVGLGVYTPGGRVSAQLMRRTPEPEPGGLYIAYTGRVTVDAAAGVVEHLVECSAIPDWVGTVLRRSFVVDGNVLTLRPLPAPGEEPEDFEAVLTWRRLED